MNRGLAFLALAGLSALPRALYPQGVPDALRDNALAVRVFAVVPMQPVPSLQGSAQSPAQGSAQGVAPDGAPGAAPAPSLPDAQGQPASATKDKSVDWQVQSVKYTVPGSPVPFKFVGVNVVVLVQVTPFSRQDGQGLVLVTQGQVWVKNKDGGISYRTTINTLSVGYGEKVFFFPLGLDSTGKAPLRLEIAVLHAADLPMPPNAASGANEAKSGPGEKTGPGEKAGPNDKANK